MSGRTADILFILFGVVVLIAIGLWSLYQSTGRQRRAKQAFQYAKKNRLTFKHYFSKFINDFGGFRCFSEMIDPSFCNVIERLDKDNGDLYIGELQWEIAVERRNNRRNRNGLVSFGNFIMNEPPKNYVKIKKETTLCVLYDDGFELPDFDLSRETLGDKAAELFKMNETEDIDFDSDKEFSNAWWLSSNENMIVKGLFTSNIRAGLMNFVNRNYRICGRGNAFFIMTYGPLSPDNYSQLITDIRSIARLMRSNKKFYIPLSERNKEIEKKEFIS